MDEDGEWTMVPEKVDTQENYNDYYANEFFSIVYESWAVLGRGLKGLSMFGHARDVAWDGATVQWRTIAYWSSC
jgi:hypothetical protein